MARFRRDRNERDDLRAVGVVHDFGRLDSRGLPIGHITAASGDENLYFEGCQAPPDLRAGDAVSFGRAVFRSDNDDTDKAVAIRRLSESLNDPGVREACVTSRLPRLWPAFAADHLHTLEVAGQVGWLRDRSADLSLLPAEAWEMVELQALRDAAIWKAAPAELRDTLSGRVREVLETDFLSASGQFADEDSAFPPLEECQRLKIQFVIEWAKQELELTLDEEQAASVAAVNGDVQVIARAGSGKTRALVTRAIFLQTHCNVSPSEIRLLAFNKKAASEMSDRLERALEGSLPHSMTFHALAYALVHPEEEIIYDETSADQLGASIEVQDVIDERIRSNQHGTVIQELMLAYFKEDWERIREGGFHLGMDEFVSHRRSLPRETLNGEHVKSFGEKLIANTLFEHDIKYKYQSNFRWNDINYRPDFMIGDFRNGGVIIDYFGSEGDADYDEMSAEKRRFWADKKGWKFLEYSPQQIACLGAPDFGSQLLEDLAQNGVSGQPLSKEEVWQRIRCRAIDSFTKAMKQFVGQCRKLSLGEDDLRNRISAHVCSGKAEELFLEVGESIHSRYAKKITESGKEDFDGLMWRAVDKVREGCTRFVRNRGEEQGDLRNLRFVMVDEFQDFSEMFSALLDSTRQHNPMVEFFCVGDDWQAINRFAGSELRFFEQFSRYFLDVSQVQISTNHRSSKAIVEAGNALMYGLGEPARPRNGAHAGEVQVGAIDEFTPSGPEQERHQGDELTPAVLRLVGRYLRQGLDVVMLSRRNGLPWWVNYREQQAIADGLERFQEHIRSFFPEEDRKRISISTTHKYKGLEKPAVVILDAVGRSYPLVHPHWVFLRMFGNSIDKIVEEERRLFYVAITRAEESLTLLTENTRRSEFLDDIERNHLAVGLKDGHEVERVRWDELAPVVSLDGALLEIQIHSAYEIREELKSQGYRFNGSGKYWAKSANHEGFSFDDLRKQPWASSPKIRIEVYSESHELLNSHPG